MLKKLLVIIAVLCATSATLPAAAVAASEREYNDLASKALLYAAKNNDAIAAYIALAAGANPNVQTPFNPHELRGTRAGDRPMHWAAAQGCVYMINLLLQFGADINALGACNAIQPLDRAFNSGRPEIIQFLRDRGAISNLEKLLNRID